MIRRMLATAKFIAQHPLTRDRPVAALGRFARWQVVSRLRGEVIVPWIGGAWLAVRHGMTGATGNIYCGLHEFADMAFVLHVLRSGDLFVDVGANVGSYTVLATKVCRASSIAIEPDPGTATSLRRNLAINGIERDVEVVEAALGASESRVQFTVGLDTCNRVATKSDSRVREVQMLTLDKILDTREPTMLELDVEGFEAAVLAGAARTLAKSSLIAILTETTTGGVSEQLVDAGFKPASYEPWTRNLSALAGAELGRGRAANALFVRDIDGLRERISAAPRRRILGHWV
jgi:FkbM family methyltransferase